MSMRIRTSFGGGGGTANTAAASGSSACADDIVVVEGDSNVSPTSVMVDFSNKPPLAAANTNMKRESSFRRNRNSNSSKSNSNNNQSDLVINQLKRQVTTLEHEKASLEQELLNQINTVVFDKETMVETLQEKLTESESRFREERKAHSEARSSFRQQKFASCGDAKFEIFRLQDLVQELTHDKERLTTELETLQAERKKSDEALLAQVTRLETDHQAHMATLTQKHDIRLNVMEQTNAAAIADLERDLFQGYQRKLEEAELTYQTKQQDDKDDPEMLTNLQESNNELLRQVSELSSQLLEEQANNYDLQFSIDHSKSLLEDEPSDAAAVPLLQAENDTLKDKLSQSEADKENLLQGLEEQETTNNELRESLEAAQDAKTAAISELEAKCAFCAKDTATISDLETKCTEYANDMVAGKEQLEQERFTNASLRESLQADSDQLKSLESKQQEDSVTILNLQGECSSYSEEIHAIKAQLDQEKTTNVSLKEALETSQLRQELQEGAQKEDTAALFNLQTECTRYAADVETINEQLAQEKKTSAALNKSLEDIQQSYSEMSMTTEKRDIDMDSLAITLHAEKDAIEEENVDLRSQLEESRLSMELINTKMSKFESQDGELRKLQKHNEEWIALLQEESNKNSALSDDLLEQLDTAKATEILLQGTVKDQQDDISALKTEIDSREEVIAGLENQVHELREEVVHEQTTITELLNSLGEEENVNSVLHEKHTCTTTTIADLESHLEQEKKVVSGLKSSLAIEESKHTDLVSAKHEKDEEVMRLQEENSGLLDRIESMVEQLGDEQDMIQDLQSSLQEKDNVVADSAEEQNLTDRELLSLESQYATLTDEAQTLRGQLEQEQGTNSKLQDSLESTIKELQVVKKSTEKAAADFQRDRLGLLDRIGTLKEELEQSKSQIQTLKSALGCSESMLSALQASQDLKAEKLVSQETGISLLRDKAHQLRNEAHKQHGLLNIVKASLKGSQRVNKGLESEQKMLKYHFHTQTTQLEAEQTSNEAFKDSLEDLTSALADAKLETEELVTSQQEEKSLLQDQVSSFNSKLQNEEWTTKVLQGSLEDKNNANATLLITLENQRNAISIAEKEHADFSFELQSLRDQLKDSETSSVQTNTAVCALPQSEGGSHNEANMSMETQPLEQRGLNLEEGENRSEDQDSASGGPEEKFDALYLKTTVESLQEENSELRKELTDRPSMRDYSAKLEDEKVALLGEISNLENQLTQKQMRRSNSKSSLEEQQMESIVRATLDDQTTNKDLITELQGEREQLQAEIEKLQAQLQATQEARDQLAGSNILDAEEAEHLKAELEAEKSTKEKLEADCLAKDNTLKALQDDLSKAKEAGQALGEQLSNLEKTTKEESESKANDTRIGSSVQQELDSTKGWLEKSLDEVEQLRGKLEKSASLFQTTEEKGLEELEELRGKLVTSSSLLQVAEAQNQDFRIQVEQLESDLFDTKQTLAINLEELDRIQENEAEKEAESAGTRKVIKSFKSAAEHWREEADRLKTAKDEAKAQQMERESKLKAAYQREISAYKNRVEEFESKLLAENLKLRGKVDSGKKESAGQEEEVKNLTSDLEGARKILDDNQKDRKALQEKLRVLQDRLGDHEADRLEKQLLEIEEQKEINKLKVELASEQKNLADCRAEIKLLHTASGALQKKCKDALLQAESTQEAAQMAEESRKVELLRSKSIEKRANSSNETIKQEVEDLRKELRRSQGAKVQLEAQYMEKLLTIEGKHSALLIELKGKKKEISSMRSFFRGDEGSDKTREDLQIEIKELTEKTIVQGRIIHTMQKKIESLEQGKEKFFYEKRKEIMRDHSEQQSLRKENTRLREKVRDGTKERKALQAQMESFANSVGSSIQRIT